MDDLEPFRTFDGIHWPGQSAPQPPPVYNPNEPAAYLLREAIERGDEIDLNDVLSPAGLLAILERLDALERWQESEEERQMGDDL